MAAFRKSSGLCRNLTLNTGLRQFHSIKNKKINLNKLSLIGVPCTCVAFWQVWNQIRKNYNFVPIVYAAKSSEAEVGHFVPCIERLVHRK